MKLTLSSERFAMYAHPSYPNGYCCQSQEASQERDALIRDLRGALNTVSLAANLIHRCEFEGTPGERRMYLRRIQQAVRQMSDRLEGEEDC